MNANLAALLYLTAGVLFILALRGLSNPETSRRGNLFGMIGMGIAILTTLAYSVPAGTGCGAFCSSMVSPSEAASSIAFSSPG